MRVVCPTCEWRGTTDELLKAPHPFQPDEELEGCPQCRELGMDGACEIEGCLTRATIAARFDDVWQWRCEKHDEPEKRVA